MRPFWSYMLHCRGGQFYVGHTDDLERRLDQHSRGEGSTFVAERRPFELVWSEAFETRSEALEAERRIKGWSRAKKMALIRGDWGRISELAKSKVTHSHSVRAELVEAPSFPSWRTEEEQRFDKLSANGKANTQQASGALSR